MTKAPRHASEFTFQFEELPLINEDGFAAGLVTGSAEISYWQEDGYPQIFVKRIFLDGYRKATPEERAAGSLAYITKPVEVEWDRECDPEAKCFSAQLYLQIFGELDEGGSFRPFIEDKVRERLDDEREAA